MKPSPIRPVSTLTPMASMLSYFLDGLAGGDRRYFGTRLALHVTRVLAAAEAAMRPLDSSRLRRDSLGMSPREHTCGAPHGTPQVARG
jgi:hypothetical protein